MLLKVYKPASYCETRGYPVLYFFPDGGGSVYTIMDQNGIAEKAEKLILEGRIEPLLIVAVDIDRSFGVNSAETEETIETPSGKQFEKGMYEDYFIKEIIPYIDCATAPRLRGTQVCWRLFDGRICGPAYRSSQSGAVLKGGRAQSIHFQDEFPDKTVSDFLYPTQETEKGTRPCISCAEQDVSSWKSSSTWRAAAQAA
jgi:hypothetical protein